MEPGSDKGVGLGAVGRVGRRGGRSKGGICGLEVGSGVELRIQ